MGRLYDIIQAHIDAQQYGTSVRQVALAIGVSPTTVANWRNISELPSRENLEAIARVTGVHYDDAFYAACVDAGYIVEGDDGADDVSGRALLEKRIGSGRVAARGKSEKK